MPFKLPSETKENQIAVLNDYQNISISYEKKYGTEERVNWGKVLETAVHYGRVLIRRAYADWSENIPAQWELLRLGFELINVPSKRGLKNAADIKMVIDALDTFIITESPISHVLLMSGDSDFTDLVHYLRARGIYVIGMGIEGTIAEYLIRACDKYDYYDLLHLQEVAREAPATRSETKMGSADVSEARQLLRKAIDMFGSAWADGSSLKSKILRLKPDFDEISYGYERFKDFLDAQRDIVQVRIHPRGSHLEIRRVPNGVAAEAANSAEALVDKYLSILRKNNLSLTPNEYRPFILREAYSMFRESSWQSFTQTRDRLCAFFDKKYPQVLVGYVLDAVYQIPQASCLEWDLSKGQYPPDTPLWQRKARLKTNIRSPEELVAKLDEHLISVIANSIQPERIDVEAVSRILYGNKRKPEVVGYIGGLLENRPTAPPPIGSS
jgi:uncharacterized LabA/DUF88 family protein